MRLRYPYKGWALTTSLTKTSVMKLYNILEQRYCLKHFWLKTCK